MIDCTKNKSFFKAQKLIPLIFALLIFLLVVQFTTYSLLADAILKRKLLTNIYLNNKHNNITIYDKHLRDTIFVQDFLEADCGVGAGNYINLNLKNDSAELIRRFHAGNIQFRQIHSLGIVDTLRYKNKVCYRIWAFKPTWMLGKFSAYCEIDIYRDGHLILEYRYNYRWLLYFWYRLR